jgi:hypothetical protein
MIQKDVTHPERVYRNKHTYQGVSAGTQHLKIMVGAGMLGVPNLHFPPWELVAFKTLVLFKKLYRHSTISLYTEETTIK